MNTKPNCERSNELMAEMYAALKAIRSGASREKGKDSCDQPFVHLRAESLRRALDVLDRVERANA